MPGKTDTTSHDDPISVVLADHHPLTRALISDCLANANGFSIMAEVNDTMAALAACAVDPVPDLLILRSDLPGYSPFGATRNLQLRNTKTRIAIIFPSLIDHQLDEALSSNAHGLFSHADSPEHLIEGLRELAQDGTYQSPTIRQRLVLLERGDTGNAKQGSPLVTLTKRERDILRLIAEGLTQKQIADRFGLAPKTIDNHAGKLMIKLGLHNRVLLTRYAIREGIVTPDDPPAAPRSVTTSDEPDHPEKGERTVRGVTPSTQSPGKSPRARST